MEIEKIIASAAIGLGLIYGVYRNLTGGDKKWLKENASGPIKKRNKDGSTDKRFKENR